MLNTPDPSIRRNWFELIYNHDDLYRNWGKYKTINLIMAVQYVNLFESTSLIINYLTKQAMDPNANWEEFVQSMVWFRVFYGDTAYFVIYEIAFKYHNKLVLITAVVELSHELFLNTNDTKLFIVGIRYFIKAMIIDAITLQNVDKYIEWFAKIRQRHSTHSIGNTYLLDIIKNILNYYVKHMQLMDCHRIY